MPKIVAYSSRIWVEGPDGLVWIRADLRDWYSDDEILRKLAFETGGRTVGEVVERIDGGEVKKRDGSILSACIEKVKKPMANMDNINLYRWSDRINR